MTNQANRDLPLGMKSQLRRLDRYHGFLCHELVADGRSRVILRVWLQPYRSETQESSEIDIGQGDVFYPVEFRINVYPEDCNVEPSTGELVAEIPSSKIDHRLTFVFTCPTGAELNALVELSQRGRTVAVVRVTHGVSG